MLSICFEGFLLMKKFILAFISIILSFSAFADVDKRYVKKRMLGVDLSSRDGKGPTPVTFFENKSPKKTEQGEKLNLDKFFKAPGNFSAVAMKDGKIVYERYNKKLKANPDFHAHGMSLTKTAVGLTVGHLLCTGKINSLDDAASDYSQSLNNSIYKDITIRNLLRMASGINKNRDNERKFNHLMRNRRDNGTNNLIEVIKSVKTKFSDQGEISRYHTLDITAASILVSEITNKSVAEVFFNNVFPQINPEGSLYWWVDNNKMSLGMAGLYMKTKDWANLGNYMNKEITSKSCMGNYLLDGIKNSLSTSLRKNLRYGYYFWISEISGKQVIMLTGKWGQIVVPNHYNNSVFAILSASSKFKYKGRKIITEIVPEATKALGAF